MLNELTSMDAADGMAFAKNLANMSDADFAQINDYYKQRDELAEQYLQIDPHSPAEFRTNGIVRNVDLFYAAFDVKPTDAMWLDHDQRVRIW